MIGLRQDKLATPVAVARTTGADFEGQKTSPKPRTRRAAIIAFMVSLMEGKLDRKKALIVYEFLIGLVFILCYWIFDVGMLFSLIACAPIAVFSIYLLISTSKGEDSNTDQVN